MNIYWIMEQRDMGCKECKHFIPSREGVGVPCEKYYDVGVNDSNECSGREAKDGTETA